MRLKQENSMRSIIVTCLMALVLNLVCIQITTAQVVWSDAYWKENIKQLPQLPSGWEMVPDSIIVSPNRQRMAFKMQRGRGLIVVLDGKPSPVYRKIGKLQFSSNSLYLHYIARENGPWYLVRDTHRRFAKEFVGDPILSNQGKRTAVIFKTPRMLQVRIAGVNGPVFDEVNRDSITFSPNDKQYSYFARRGKYWYVQIDDQTAGPFEDVTGRPVYSSDSKSHAYMAQTNGQWHVVQDNKPWQVANETAQIAFHPNSKQLFAWLRVDSPNWQLHINNQPVEKAISSTPVPVIFGTKAYAWAARLIVGSQTQMIREGKTLPIHGYILPDTAQFDPKSIQLVYVTRTDDGEHVTIDDVLLEPYQSILAEDIQISRDARRIAYPAKINNQWHVIEQGEKGPTLEAIIPGSLVFSPKKQQLIYRAKSGQLDRFYIDQQMVGEFDEMSNPIFDKGHIAWAARLGNNWHLYIDGIANPTAFSNLVGPPLVTTKYGRFMTMIQQNHSTVPAYSRLVMDKLTTEEALANVNPNSIK